MISILLDEDVCDEEGVGIKEAPNQLDNFRIPLPVIHRKNPTFYMLPDKEGYSPWFFVCHPFNSIIHLSLVHLPIHPASSHSVYPFCLPIMSPYTSSPPVIQSGLMRQVYIEHYNLCKAASSIHVNTTETAKFELSVYNLARGATALVAQNFIFLSFDREKHRSA